MTKQRFMMCSWRDRDHPGVAEGHRRASRQTRVSYIHAHVHTHAESKKPMHAAYTRAHARTPGRSSRGPRSGIWQRTEVRWPHLRDAGNVVGVARVSGTFTSPARDEPGFGRLRASLESAWEMRDRARASAGTRELIGAAAGEDEVGYIAYMCRVHTTYGD